MAVILQMTYMKKLGLPNFSSHSCAVQLTVEIPDVSVVGQETTKLYQLLQSAVDNEIQEVGFMPDATTYGMNNSPTPNNGNGHHGNGQQSGNGYSSRPNGNTHQRPSGNGYTGNHGNGYHPANGNGNHEQWNCTDGQKGLILRVVNENSDKLSKADVENTAQQMFGVGVRQLDKMQASQLIEDLLERVGKKPQRSRWQRQPTQQR